MSDEAQPIVEMVDLVDLQIHQTNRRHIAPQNTKSNFWDGGAMNVDFEELFKAGLWKRIPKDELKKLKAKFPRLKGA